MGKKKAEFSDLPPSTQAALSDRALFNLLGAFVMSGWETVMPIEAALETAELLSKADGFKASQISGYLVRSKEVPPDLMEWAVEVRRDFLAKQATG